MVSGVVTKPQRAARPSHSPAALARRSAAVKQDEFWPRAGQLADLLRLIQLISHETQPSSPEAREVMPHDGGGPGPQLGQRMVSNPTSHARRVEPRPHRSVMG
ncbi:pectin methylesterase [Nocardioides sp. CF8]|nr:pectin methylesterase [Nocardioides sp. CF8]